MVEGITIKRLHFKERTETSSSAKRIFIIIVLKFLIILTIVSILILTLMLTLILALIILTKFNV